MSGKQRQAKGDRTVLSGAFSNEVMDERIAALVSRRRAEGSRVTGPVTTRRVKRIPPRNPARG